MSVFVVVVVVMSCCWAILPMKIWGEKRYCFSGVVVAVSPAMNPVGKKPEEEQLLFLHRFAGCCWVVTHVVVVVSVAVPKSSSCQQSPFARRWPDPWEVDAVEVWNVDAPVAPQCQCRWCFCWRKSRAGPVHRPHRQLPLPIRRVAVNQRELKYSYHSLPRHCSYDFHSPERASDGQNCVPSWCIASKMTRTTARAREGIADEEAGPSGCFQSWHP